MPNIRVEPSSELGRAVLDAEERGDTIRLNIGTRSFVLEPESDGTVEGEIAVRRALMKRTLANRDRQQPLGITTAQLIREARAERFGE